MSTINSGDKFLVNRNNTSYQLEAQNTMAELQDTDLMLVNRGGTSYKITGADIKESLDPTAPPTINGITLTEDDPGGDRFSGQNFTTTVNMGSEGVPTGIKSISGTLSAQLVDYLETAEITDSVNATGTWSAAGDANTFPTKKWTGCASDGNGTWLVVGRAVPFYLRSFDNGITWEQLPYPNGTTYNATKIAYANGRWVLASTQFGIAYSDNNGTSWTTSSANQDNECQDVCTDGHGNWCVVNSSSADRVWFSTDNAASFQTAGQFGDKFYGCAYGNGTWVVVGENRIYFSGKGYDDWQQAMYDNDLFLDVAFGNNMFVCVTNGGTRNVQIRYSYDGTKWWKSTRNKDNKSMQTVDYCGGYWLFGTVTNSGSDSQIFWTLDPTEDLSYTDSAIDFDNLYSTDVFDFGYCNGQFIAVGSNFVWSSDTGGNSESHLTFATSKDLEDFKPGDPVLQNDGATNGVVAYYGDPVSKTMRIRNVSGVWRSNQGKSVRGPERPAKTSAITACTTSAVRDWSSATTGLPRQYWSDVVYGEDEFVMIGTSRNNTAEFYIAKSPDGINWTTSLHNLNSNGYTKRMAYSPELKIYVALTDSSNGRHVRSLDNGATWESFGSLNTNLEGVAAGHDENGVPMFVVVGTAQIFYSYDAITWTENNTGQSINNFRAVACGEAPDGKVRWCAVGVNSSAFNWSDNGREWYTAPSVQSSGDYRDVAWGYSYGKGVWVTCKDNSPVTSNEQFMVSYDGKDWRASMTLPWNNQAGKWRYIVYANGVFVCSAASDLGGDGRLAFTYDGTFWNTNSGFQGADNPLTSAKMRGLCYSPEKQMWVIAFYDTNACAYSPTAGIPNQVVTFTNSTDLDKFKVGDYVRQEDGGPNGYVMDVSQVGSNKLSIYTQGMITKEEPLPSTQSAQPFDVGTKLFGENQANVVSTTLYPVLTEDLEVRDLSIIPQTPVQFNGNAPKIEFPEVLPDGRTPDETLLAGTAMTTTVTADNLVYNPVSATSNSVTPNSTRVAGTFDGSDPADVAEFNTLKASFDTYEENRDTRRANLKSAMLAANFTNEEIATAGLADA